MVIEQQCFPLQVQSVLFIFELVIYKFAYLRGAEFSPNSCYLCLYSRYLQILYRCTQRGGLSAATSKQAGDREVVGGGGEETVASL